MTQPRTDSVVKTLLILFAIAIALPCLAILAVVVFYVWVGLAMSHG